MPEEQAMPIDLLTLNEGALVEGFELELRRVLENIADLNTSPTAARAIVLKITLRPSGDRVTLDAEIECGSKLAPPERSHSKIFLGRATDGSPVAFPTDPRQLPLWTKPAPKEAPPPLEFRSS